MLTYADGKSKLFSSSISGLDRPTNLTGRRDMENKVISIETTDSRVNWRSLDSKEVIRTWHLVGNKANEGRMAHIAEVKCYMGKAASSSVVYATVRVMYDNNFLSGAGRAGGGGYCKQSASVAEAFESAGVTLEKDIRGRGETAVTGALEALARHYGFKRFLVIG